MSLTIPNILTAEQTESFSKFTESLTKDQLLWASGYLAGLLAQQTKTAVPETVESKPTDSIEPGLTILYGSRTGNGDALAKRAQEIGTAQGLKVTLKSMNDYKPRDLQSEKNLIVIVSTHGEGEPPFAAKGLHEYIFGKRATKLEGVKYAVLALGDSTYFQFCRTGKDFNEQLEKLGATRQVPLIACDIDFEDQAEKWLNDTILSFASENVVSPTKATRQFRMDLPKQGEKKEKQITYSKKNPFQASVLEKISLHGKGSNRQTLHLELNTEDAKELTYEPGDAAGIIPLNSVELVNEVLRVTGLSGDSEVEVKGNKSTLFNVLHSDFELSKITVDVVNRYLIFAQNEQLQQLVDNTDKFKEYLKSGDIVDLFQDYPSKLTAQDLIELLRPLQARFYSISSSPKAFPGELHLTVGLVEFEDNGRHKKGTCSTYLSEIDVENGNVKLFIESNPGFRLPENEQTPIIMVGAGTGIAPYRAFVQHRELGEHPGKSWLFFGNRNFETEFLYQTEWHDFLKTGALTNMDVAFSRDGEKKVYVQDRLLEKASEVFQWLEDGAHFYICGDMKSMARQVQDTLVSIVESQGGLSKENAQEYVGRLQSENKLQMDVY